MLTHARFLCPFGRERILNKLKLFVEEVYTSVMSAVLHNSSTCVSRRPGHSVFV